MNQFVCPNCNATILSNVTFCPKCGQKIDIKLSHDIYSKDLYHILQVTPEADPEVVEAAYKKLAAKYHPDLNKSQDATQRMQELNEAFQILGNEELRANYDQYWRKEKTTSNINQTNNRNQAPKTDLKTEKISTKQENLPNRSNPSIAAVIIILGMIIFVLAILYSDNQNSSPTISPATRLPTVKPTNTKIYITATLDQNSMRATQAASCTRWDKINPVFKGKYICVFGIVSSQKELGTIDKNGYSTWTLIRFNEHTTTFYLTSDYKFKFRSGDCIVAKEILEYDTNGIPFMKVSELYKCTPSMEP